MSRSIRTHNDFQAPVFFPRLVLATLSLFVLSTPVLAVETHLPLDRQAVASITIDTIDPITTDLSGNQPGDDRPTGKSGDDSRSTDELLYRQTAAEELLESLPVQSPVEILQSLSNENIVSQRLNYRQAKIAIEQRQFDKFQQLRLSLLEYPLLTHLDYLYFAKRIHQIGIGELEQRFKGENNTHYLQRLKKAKLRRWANAGQWASVVKYYDAALADDNLRCHYARALYKTGQFEQAKALNVDLWLTPRSMPEACNPVFHQLKKEGLIDSQLAWQRFSAAFPAGEISLSKYLINYLKEEHRKTAEAILAFYQNPKFNQQQWVTLTNLLNNNNIAGHANSETMVFGTLRILLKRLVRSDPEAAVEIINKPLRKASTTGLSEERHQALIADIKQYLLQRTALKDYNGIPQLYSKLGKPRDAVSLGWKLRSLIATAQWSKLYDAINELPDSMKSEERWVYWSLRAKQLKNKLSQKDKEQLQEISDNPNFYGFFAAYSLNRQQNIAPAERTPDSYNLTRLAHNIRAQRAIEHFIHGETIPANREWLRGTANYSGDALLDAAYLAATLGWHHQAINTAARARAWRHYAIRFPDIYTEQFQREAFRYQQFPQWFYATARQESALLPSARSSAGALGLMQILPSTGKQLAQNIGLDYARNLLYQPDYSIKLGTAYLAELHTKYNNRALSSAAYNAGPHRVDTWLKNLKQAIPLDAWVETIRFSETRQYVQNILSFSLIHHHLHGDSQARGLWPAFSFLTEEEQTVFPFEQTVQRN